MANQPSRRNVQPSHALIEQAESTYGPDRGADGSPSFDDFEAFMLPHLIEAVAVTWHQAQPVDGYEGMVRELATRPHGMFGPALVTGYDDGDTVWLIGFEPDASYWRHLNELGDLDDPC